MGLFSFEALYQAYLACRRRKRQTCNTQRFERQLLDHLFALHEQLQTRSYRLGYIVRPGYRLVRKRVVGNLRARLNDFARDHLRHGAIGRNPYRHLQLRPKGAQGLRQTLASYLGHFRHANSYRLVQGLFHAYPWLNELFALKTAPLGLVRRDAPVVAPRSLAAQYAWFVRRFTSGCLFFQVGRFIEFYGQQAHLAAGWFGLKLGSSRHGLGPCCGFPVRLLKRYKARARQLHLSYAVVAHTGQVLQTGLQCRELTEILFFERQQPALLSQT